MKGGSELPETIGAKELPLVGIFNDNYRFEIPDYSAPTHGLRNKLENSSKTLCMRLDDPNQ